MASNNLTIVNNHNHTPQVLWQSYANFGINFQSTDLFFRRLYELSQELLNELPTDETATQSVWERVAEMFLQNQTVAMDVFKKASTLYMIRPNPQYRNELRERLNKNVPSRDDDYDPQKTIGLPIRASDKCRKESSCLSFERYMELAMYTWKESFPDE
jgi:hypothetical protein